MKDRDFMRYSRQILLEETARGGKKKPPASGVRVGGLGG